MDGEDNELTPVTGSEAAEMKERMEAQRAAEDRLKRISWRWQGDKLFPLGLEEQTSALQAQLHLDLLGAGIDKKAIDKTTKPLTITMESGDEVHRRMKEILGEQFPAWQKAPANLHGGGKNSGGRGGR